MILDCTYTDFSIVDKVNHMIVFNDYYHNPYIHRVAYAAKISRGRKGIMGIWRVKYKTTETPFG